MTNLFTKVADLEWIIIINPEDKDLLLEQLSFADVSIYKFSANGHVNDSNYIITTELDGSVQRKLHNPLLGPISPAIFRNYNFVSEILYHCKISFKDEADEAEFIMQSYNVSLQKTEWRLNQGNLTAYSDILKRYSKKWYADERKNYNERLNVSHVSEDDFVKLSS